MEREQKCVGLICRHLESLIFCSWFIFGLPRNYAEVALDCMMMTLNQCNTMGKNTKEITMRKKKYKNNVQNEQKREENSRKQNPRKLVSIIDYVSYLGFVSNYVNLQCVHSLVNFAPVTFSTFASKSKMKIVRQTQSALEALHQTLIAS